MFQRVINELSVLWKTNRNCSHKTENQIVSTDNFQLLKKNTLDIILNIIKYIIYNMYMKELIKYINTS